ncbi:MAG: GNAT family N-acetyltransferase [Candidatus Zixiibacteriota bacterium]|nr:MAG: GNAT family N-acetyltransferase [candidate division Zixibacteria bacterium]
MALKLRTAEPGDLEALVQLQFLSYPLLNWTPEQRRAYYTDNARAGLEDMFVVTSDDELVASMIAYRFTQVQEEVEIPVVGIGSVAVSPDRRREGIAAFLIQKTLQGFEEEGVPASILYPFQHRFYRRLGWGYGGDLLQYRIAADQLFEYEDLLEDSDLSVKMVTPDQVPDLMAFYDASMRHSNGLLKRNERYWRERVLAAPRLAVTARFSGDIIGYFLCSYQAAGEPERQSQELEVHEWLAPNLDARDALLSYIARQRDQIDSMRFFLPADEPLHLWVEDPRDLDRRHVYRLFHTSATLGLGWMYRLVNLQAAFESGRKFNGVQGELTVDLVDEVLGDRRVNVKFTGKGAKLQDPDDHPRRTVQGTMDMFSQMFCGYTNPGQAYEQGLLGFEGEDTVEFCQRAFWLPPPRCYDLF